MNISGSIVALVTPMDKNGEIVFSDVNNLVDYHLNNNTEGLVLFGTTGEGYAIDSTEKEKLVRHVIEKVNGKVPVIVGTGHNCTKKTIDNTKFAKYWGADAALIVTPYYNKPSQNGLIAHYKSIANSVDLPIILYNVPSRTVCDLQPETVAILAQESNIVALKEAVSDLNRIKKLVELCPPDFNLLSGDDESFLEFCKLGGHGVISVSCNVMPRQIAEICRLAKNKDWIQCEAINKTLTLLHKNLFLTCNPVPVKWALYYLGLILTPECRLPLLALEDQYKNPIINALRQAGCDKIN